MSGEDANWLDWRQFGKIEWAFLAGLAVLVLGGAIFAFSYVSKADPPPLPELPAAAQTQPSALGYIVSASDDKIVIELGNTKKRTFVVRPQDRPHVGIPYLDAHAGNRESGFLIYYERVGGTEYALGAVETEPPPFGAG
jgi:hypothetical protein